MNVLNLEQEKINKALGKKLIQKLREENAEIYSTRTGKIGVINCPNELQVAIFEKLRLLQ